MPVVVLSRVWVLQVWATAAGYIFFQKHFYFNIPTNNKKLNILFRKNIVTEKRREHGAVAFVSFVCRGGEGGGREAWLLRGVEKKWGFLWGRQDGLNICYLPHVACGEKLEGERKGWIGWIEMKGGRKGQKVVGPDWSTFGSRLIMNCRLESSLERTYRRVGGFRKGWKVDLQLDWAGRQDRGKGGERTDERKKGIVFVRRPHSEWVSMCSL